MCTPKRKPYSSHPQRLSGINLNEIEVSNLGRPAFTSR